MEVIKIIADIIIATIVWAILVGLAYWWSKLTNLQFDTTLLLIILIGIIRIVINTSK